MALTLLNRQGNFAQRMGRELREGFKRWSSGRGGLVVALVLALIGAPAWSALRNECDLCPRTCPMHRDSDPAHASNQHLGCHSAPAGAQHRHALPHGGKPAVSRAACGNHGVLPATVLPPVILPAVHGLPTLVAQQSPSRLESTRPDRLADPPDTPPPIVAA